MIGGLVQQILAADAGFIAVAGNRIYPDVLPQAPTYPACTYMVVSGSALYTMEGPADLADPRLQLDIYGETKAQVVSVYAAVMGALSGFKGDAGGVHIQGIFKAMETDNFAGDMERAGPRTYRKTIDFNIWFEEAF
jgi:hypothetical protein